MGAYEFSKDPLLLAFFHQNGQPAGERRADGIERRRTKLVETMEGGLEERKRTKRDMDGKAEVRQQQ